MSQALPGLVSVCLGLALVWLGRWGIRNVEDLVSPVVAAPRRQREIRTIRRGSRSCVVLGGLFCVAGTVLVTSGAHL